MQEKTSEETVNITEARKRSIDNLQRLYTVVVSLAITEMLKRVLMPADKQPPATYIDYLMVLSFLATVIPFYHGANRYLDATYVTGERSAKHFALIVDFLFLFFEGIVLFALAVFVGKHPLFYYLLAGLLLLDILWVWTTSFTASENQPKRLNFGRWAGINAVAAVLIWVSAASNLTKWTLWPDEVVQHISLAGIAVIRTIIDYWLVWSEYYPKGIEGTYDNIPAPPPASAPSKPASKVGTE